MSLKATINGVAIEVNTLAELKELIATFGSGEAPSAKSNNGSVPPASAPPPKKEPRRDPIGEISYMKYSWRYVRLLLEAPHNVGKLQISLATELGINHNMVKRILDRLITEKPTFLHIQKTSRGQSPYIRITDEMAAKNFAEAQEQLWKEYVQKEMGGIDK